MRGMLHACADLEKKTRGNRQGDANSDACTISKVTSLAPLFIVSKGSPEPTIVQLYAKRGQSFPISGISCRFHG